MAGLRAREPVALIILAHYAVVLQTLDKIWFLKGWSMHIVRRTMLLLSSSTYAPWSAWPLMQIQQGEADMEMIADLVEQGVV